MSAPDFVPEPGADAREVPTRLLVVQEELRPPVHGQDAELVMTFPHLLVREMIALVAVSLVLVVVAMLFDAPLEELANPDKTPNPAKAPWYFLGLQELLHYYPPLISGVILPGLVMAALVVIPYFEVNLKREPLWQRDRGIKLVGVTTAIIVIAAVFYVTGAHPVWPLIGPTVGMGLLMLLPGLLGADKPLLRWLGMRSLSWWIFMWFLASSVVLTIIGVFFRGPGWTLTTPWTDGIF